MIQSKARHNQVAFLRMVRKVHRITGIFLFSFFIIISLSGFLLGWKKHSAGIMLPKSYIGTSTNLEEWLSVDQLHKLACKILHDSVSANLSIELDRIDIRKDKGIVKFLFVDGFWEIQLDGSTGKLLNIQKRYSDIIEKIHDASLADYLLNTSDGQIKLVYTSVTGIALFLFSVTGFWLWYGPKRIRRQHRYF
jgi:uncharacterized iron-regulated membrane protein